MKARHYLGVDVGTGGAKALIVREDGSVAASVTTEYPLLTPRPLWSEQDPDSWWKATVSSICAALDEAGLTGSSIAAVGLTGQMHGLVLLDRADELLRPAILWNDQRTETQCNQIHDIVGRESLIRITGKPAITGFTAPKVLWVRQHEPHIYERAASMLLPKDYVRYRMTGARLSDVADASGTSLFDVEKRAWSEQLIDQLEIPRRWLPEVTESAVMSSQISAEVSSLTGLLEGTPVAAGAGDQAAEAVGCGVVRDGAVSVSVGTSGVVFAASDSYRLERAGRLHAYCHAAPGRWHLMGVMLSAGGSFRWYRDALGAEEKHEADARGVDPYEVLIEGAADATPGCEGLFFLPYLTGERTPHADPHARGAFIGLTLRHGKKHMTRAVMEGVTFGLMDSIELTRELGVEVDSVRISGGGSRSALWRQIMADVFNAEVATVNVSAGAAYGAAVIAAAGAGAFPSVEDAAAQLVRETGRTSPSQDVGLYADSYHQYRMLYPALQREFRNIAMLAEEHGGDS